MRGVMTDQGRSGARRGSWDRVAKKRAGFTLIELMVVLAILALLAAIAIPVYGSYVKDAKYAQAKGNLTLLATLMERYYQNHNAYYPSTTDLLPNDPPTTTTLTGWDPGNNTLFVYAISNPDNGSAPAACGMPTPPAPSYLLTATPTASSGLSNKVAFYLDSNNNRCQVHANGTVTKGW